MGSDNAEHDSGEGLSHMEMSSTLIDCLRMVLRPLVKFCLKNAIGLQEFLESAKVVFIDVAAEDMRRREEKVNISRLSVITGVHRKDAVRIYRERDIDDTSSRFTSRVINQWRKDLRFLDKSRRPRVLSFEGENSEFSKLVNLVSTDLHPGTILFDLERLGAIERTKTGLKLKVRAYVPRHNPKEGFRMLGADTQDLMEAVQENIFSDTEELPNYHAKVVYDNIDESDIPKVRKWLFDRASAFHQRALDHLAKYDLDVYPNKKKKGGKRIVLGLFSRS